MKRAVVLFLILCHWAAAQTVVQKLFSNVSAIGTASIQNTGQLGHQVYALATNAPARTCGQPIIQGQLEFSFDQVNWVGFGSPLFYSSSLQTPLSVTYLGSGTFNYVRFRLVSFDTLNCLISAWYTGSTTPIYLANQGPVASPTSITTRSASGLSVSVNPMLGGGIASFGNVSPLVLCDLTAQVTATAGTAAVVMPSSGPNGSLNVCSVAVTMATTGTFQFVTGTGTTCATGRVSLSPVFNLNAGTPFTLGNGTGIVMSNIVAVGFSAGTANLNGDICVVAVTGNVSVMATYALY